MTKDRIRELADFFFSSDDSNDVPIRLACYTGRYTGFDLNKESFIELFTILNKSKNLKMDLLQFREKEESNGEK